MWEELIFGFIYFGYLGLMNLGFYFVIKNTL